MITSLLLPLALLVLAPRAPAQSAPERPAPFRARVEAFWTWFGAHADEYRKGMLARDAATVAEVTRELRTRLGELAPGLSFGANPGPEPESMRIHLAPGRERVTQLLGREIAAAMPKLAGWECLPWRAPGDMSASIGTLGKEPLLPRDFRVAGEWDSEKQRLGLAVWHDGFGRLDAGQRELLARRLVDQALGGAMLARCPPDVRVLESRPADDAEGVLAGDELYATLVEFLRGENFDAAIAPELVEDYYGPPAGEFPDGSRLADLLSGASRCTDLVADCQLLGSRATLDALERLGAGAGIVGFAHTIERRPLDPDSGLALIGLRESVAKELDARLVAAHAGTVLGWADGRTREWIDVLFFDEAAATPILRAVLAAQAQVTAARLYSFDPARPEPGATLK